MIVKLELTPEQARWLLRDLENDQTSLSWNPRHQRSEGDVYRAALIAQLQPKVRDPWERPTRW